VLLLALLFRTRRQALTALFVFLILPILIPAAGQRRLEEFRGGALTSPPRPSRSPTDGGAQSGEFTFARVVYDSPHSPYNVSFGGAWRVDFPEADENFITGLREWVGTNLRVSARPVQLRVTDERLFDYPLAYIVEPGHMELSDQEAASLREYLLRGGFLFLDDFHGEAEWQRAHEQLKKVLPEYEVKDLPPTHAIFHSYFDLDGIVQVPGVAALVQGVTYEKGGVTPHYMGVEDGNGRLMIFLTRNCDLGDAWEWINDPRYPMRYGVVAYRVGINVVIYAMSH
jgi:hypothetical protein